jgi:hypothetical protein
MTERRSPEPLAAQALGDTDPTSAALVPPPHTSTLAPSSPSRFTCAHGRWRHSSVLRDAAPPTRAARSLARVRSESCSSVRTCLAMTR